MKITNLLVRLIFLSLGGCANSGQRDERFGASPSELNAQKTSLDDQRVELRGYLIHEAESYGVWDSLAAMKAGNPSSCLSLLYPMELQSRVISANRKSVRIVGVFHRNVASGVGVRLGLCNYTGIKVEKIDVD